MGEMTEYRGSEIVFKIPPDFISVVEAAELLGITGDTIRKALKEGTVPPDDVKYFVKHVGARRKHPCIRKSIMNNWGGARIPDQSTAERNRDVKHRADLAKAEKLEIELLKAKNELVDVAKMRQLFVSVAVDVRQAMLSLIPRLAPQLVDLDDMHAIHELLEDEITRALRALDEPQDL